MVAYKCDRCGRLYEEKTLEKKIVIDVDELHMVDLCPNCYRMLYNFLRKPMKQHAKVVEYETPELNGGWKFD